MPKCIYCGRVYEFPRGLSLITKDGNVHYLENLLFQRVKLSQRSLKINSFQNINLSTTKCFFSAERFINKQGLF
jgi:hypothetical protein